jgi:N-acetylglutamate synthase-like GNAT family acetyltransferase
MYIDFLKNKMEHMETINRWLYNQWGYHDSDGSEEKWLIDRKDKLNNSKLLPIIFIALEEETPIGTASIVKSDMKTHPELEPWLANVYVKEDKRGNGFGTKLVKRGLKESKLNNFKKLYLFTPDKKKFYQKIGWKLYKHEEYRNEMVEIMKYSLQGADI